MSHVTRLYATCHNYQGSLQHMVRDASPKFAGHVTLMNELCHIYEWGMSHVCMIHVTFIRKPATRAKRRRTKLALLRACTCHDMTHSYVWHDSFICVTWLIYMCDMPHWNVWHDSFVCVTWLICMCDMTHLYVLHDSFVCVTWLICICDMTQPYA